MTALIPSAVPQLSNFPRVLLGHYPTQIEHLSRLSGLYQGKNIYVKRDDCTGLGFGGNKVRQLEYYLGDAISKGCDTVLSTGAVQSNYMRILAAAASKLGLECHIQLENRVNNSSHEYETSGNRLLTGLFGASISYYPHGEDEQGADREIHRIADELAQAGKKPYVVPLSMVKKPKGALGYIEAAHELIQQFDQFMPRPDLVIVGSGSGLTHSGLLSGFRLLGEDVPVLGACVRRSADIQKPRILTHCDNLSEMLEIAPVVSDDDVWVDDSALAPGYGQISTLLQKTIHTAATMEGLLLDPVYSGKTLACLLEMIESGKLEDYHNILFIHTGGTPAIFAYQNELENYQAQ